MTTELIEFARSEFTLGAIQPDGSTSRDHLEKSAKSIFKPNYEAQRQLAEAAELPDEGGNVWADFLALHSRRGYGEIGPVRLSYTEVQAFESLRGFRFEGWELEAILALDDEFFAVEGEKK